VVSLAPLASAGIEPIFSGGASIYSQVFDERDARAEALCRRDELGLLVEERGPAPSPRRWAYTPNGWVRWYTDHDGGRYEFEFAGGNMRSVARDPLGRTIRYEYTLTDEISAVTDPAGNRHTYRHDLRDALTEVRHYGQLVESYKHDRAGNLIAKHDALGGLLVSYQYGADGLKSQRTLSDGEEHRYAYTREGSNKDRAQRFPVCRPWARNTRTGFSPRKGARRSKRSAIRAPRGGGNGSDIVVTTRMSTRCRAGSRGAGV
jgi:YD repeat-containing protein